MQCFVWEILFQIQELLDILIISESSTHLLPQAMYLFLLFYLKWSQQTGCILFREPKYPWWIFWKQRNDHLLGFWKCQWFTKNFQPAKFAMFLFIIFNFIYRIPTRNWRIYLSSKYSIQYHLYCFYLEKNVFIFLNFFYSPFLHFLGLHIQRY